MVYEIKSINKQIHKKRLRDLFTKEDKEVGLYSLLFGIGFMEMYFTFITMLKIAVDNNIIKP